MNSLLPPGSSPLERRAAEACAGISDLLVPLRDLWNPAHCSIKFLPYLAWAFSVDGWDEKWPEAKKRKAVIDAFLIHQKKGTCASVRQVVEDMGYSATLVEWFDIGDPSGTFRLDVDVNDLGITEIALNELNRLISGVKPVSRHISQMSITARTSGITHIGTAHTCGDIITVYPPDYSPEINTIYDGMIFHDGNFDY